MSKLNISIEQNASYGLTLNLREDDTVTPRDITNWSLTGSIKESYDAPTPLMFFAMDVPSAISGSITAFLSADQTWNLSGSAYYYDIIANDANTSPLETYRLLYGRVKIIRGVTEP